MRQQSMTFPLPFKGHKLTLFQEWEIHEGGKRVKVFYLTVYGDRGHDAVIYDQRQGVLPHHVAGNIAEILAENRGES